MKKYIFIVFYCFSLLSCMKNQDKHNIAQKIDSATLMKSECDASYLVINTENCDRVDFDYSNDRIKSIKYIGLKSEVPIASFYQLMLFDEKIYVLDNISEKVFIFDINGTIVNVIDSRGGGPQEYTGLGTMCVSKEENCLIVFDRLSMSLLYYSLDGVFIKKERGIANCFIESYGNKIINQLDFGQSFSEDMSLNFHLVSTLTDSVIKKAFPLYPIQKETVVEKSLSYNSNGDLLCIPLYSDTVYQIVNDSIFTIRYVFEQKKSIWEYNQKSLTVIEKGSLISDEKYTCIGKPFLETDNFISYRIKFSDNKSNLIASSNYYFDKAKKKSFYFASKQEPKSISNYIPFAETIYGNYFVGYMSQYNIESVRYWGKTHEFHIENENLRNLIDSDTDWEGIIIMYELQ